MILSPTYTAMVLCQELSAADYGAGGQPAADLERKFYGLWTFEPALVQETVELAIAHIGRYNPELANLNCPSARELLLLLRLPNLCVDYSKPANWMTAS